MKEDPPEYQKPGDFLGLDVDMTRHDIIGFLEHALIGPDMSSVRFSDLGMLDYRFRHLQQNVLAVLYKLREPELKKIGRIDLRGDA